MRTAPIRFLALSSVAVAIASILWAQSASAAYISCADTTHLNSDNTRCYSFQSGSIPPGTYTGAWMQTHANNFGPGSPTNATYPYMENNTVWWSDGGGFYTETGLTSRWNSLVNLNTYGPYWEETWIENGQSKTGGNFPYYMSPNGSTMTFQISRGPQVNSWNFYMTGVNGAVYTTQHQNYWTGVLIQSGGELWTSNHGAFANTFDNYLKVLNGSGNGVSVPGMSASQPGFIDRVNNNGSITQPICCLNGSAWYNSEWSWNASIS